MNRTTIKTIGVIAWVVWRALSVLAGSGNTERYIEPDLIQTLQTDGSATFFIVLSDQADTGEARFLTSKREKGRFVYDKLTRHARRTQSDLIRLFEQHNAAYTSYWITNMLLVEGDMELFQRLIDRDDISAMYLNRKFRADLGWDDEPPVAETSPMAPADGTPDGSSDARPDGTREPEWNIARVHAPEVWNYFNVKGRNIVLMSNDTGVEWDHWALIDQYRGWNGTTANHDYCWFDPTGAFPDAPGDDRSHGTHVTGTMVGEDGTANIVGVAPEAQWIACKVIDWMGDLEIAWAHASFEWALAPTRIGGSDPNPDMAPHAINNSWGVHDSTYPYFETDVQNCVNAGIFVAFAAGNSGPTCGTLSPTSGYMNTCAVGSSSIDYLVSDYSSRGPGYFYPGITKPDVTAPGKSVRSTIPGNTYGIKSGTSMACPHVTGLVALLWEAEPDLIGNVDYTRWIIETSASATIDDQCGSGDPPNNVYGYGDINCHNAAAIAMVFPTPVPTATPVHTATPLFTHTPTRTPTPTGFLYVPSQYSTIQAAINAAQDGYTIIIADGIYSGTGNTDINTDGKRITIVSENGPGNCILDGENVNDRRAFRINQDETRDTIIRGLTIRNMLRSGSYGAALYITGSSPTIADCIFSANAAGNGGACYINDSADPLITGCVFDANACAYTGSAIGISNANADVTCCLFINHPDECIEVIGSTQSGISILNSTITGNTIGVKSASPAIFIHNSIVWGNTTKNLDETMFNFNVTYSNIGSNSDGHPGTGNIDADPLFVSGSKGDYYLSLSPLSPCINSGGDAAVDVCSFNGESTVCMSDLTTR
ncbi:S8 family serine peptidase, partial [bacterium]|nr:S8 family serine peptidase [candidate division CSSED10-310 bacterium]